MPSYDEIFNAAGIGNEPGPEGLYPRQLKWSDLRRIVDVTRDQLKDELIPRPDHTPGPWSVDEDSVRSDRVNPDHASETTYVCDVNTDHPQRVWEANALLIAAAPTMLETLESVYRRFDEHPHSWNDFTIEEIETELTAAIDKVKGRVE